MARGLAGSLCVLGALAGVGTIGASAAAGHGAEERDLRDALAGMDVRSLTWQPPTMEDAFIALVSSPS